MNVYQLKKRIGLNVFTTEMIKPILEQEYEQPIIKINTMVKKGELIRLATRLMQSCKALSDTEIELPTMTQHYTPQIIINLLKKRIESLDIDMAAQDVRRFIYDEKELNVWSKEFFSGLIPMLKFK
jgi:hypothetical protein